MAAAADEEIGGGREALFERSHAELVQEARALAESCGAGVTVLAVSPRSGAPRLSRFAGDGHGPEQLARELRRSQEKVAGMNLSQVLAFEEWLRAVKLRVERRIREEEEAAGGRAAAEDQQARPPLKQRRLG